MFYIGNIFNFLSVLNSEWAMKTKSYSLTSSSVKSTRLKEEQNDDINTENTHRVVKEKHYVLDSDLFVVVQDYENSKIERDVN